MNDKKKGAVNVVRLVYTVILLLFLLLPFW